MKTKKNYDLRLKRMRLLMSAIGLFSLALMGAGQFDLHPLVIIGLSAILSFIGMQFIFLAGETDKKLSEQHANHKSELERLRQAGVKTKSSRNDFIVRLIEALLVFFTASLVILGVAFGLIAYIAALVTFLLLSLVSIGFADFKNQQRKVDEEEELLKAEIARLRLEGILLSEEEDYEQAHWKQEKKS